MKFYLNKKVLKYALVVLAILGAVLLLLKLVSLWDSRQGLVDPETVQPAQPAPPQEIQAPDIIVREPTEEERLELSDGTITKDRLIQDIVDDAVAAPPEENAGTHPVESEYERRMAEIIAEAYVLRDEYVLTLENMYAEAEAALSALVKDGGTDEETASLISNYLSRAGTLEKQCDDRIDGIVAEMEQLIRDNKGDMTRLNTLIDTYVTEKAAKKAWYMERLQEKGLIS